jgi:hypothetical protein
MLALGLLFFIGFGFYKKNKNQTEFVFLKNRNRTETGSNQPVSVQFFRQRPVQTGLARFFSFDSVFSV